MAEEPTIVEYEFVTPTDYTGYKLFPAELENDPLVAFHGTAEANLKSIIQDGFKIIHPSPSASFAQNSGLSLRYACEKRSVESPRGVVIMVKFAELDVPHVKADHSCVHIYCENIQPRIIGYCIIPECYRHI